MGAGSGRDAVSVRQHNLRTLLRHVHQHGPTTRAELGRITGLTRSAVGDLVAELVARDLVLESPVAAESTRRGRPSLVVAPATTRPEYSRSASEPRPCARLGSVWAARLSALLRCVMSMCPMILGRV